MATIRTSALPYMAAIVVSVLASGLGQYIWQYQWPEFPLVYGQGPGIYLKAALVAIAAVFWLIYRGTPTKSILLRWFLALLAISWILWAGLTQLRSESTTYDSLLVLPILIGLLLKAPPKADVIAAIHVTCWLLVGIFIVVRVCELAGLLKMPDVGPLVSFEQREYWLPLSGTIGPPGRWPGPLGHNSKTGNAAAILVVVGFVTPGYRRWVFTAVGVLVLLLTASRGSIIGAAAGVLAVLIIGDNPLTRRVSRQLLAIIASSVSLIALAAVVMRNPGLTGRDNYWSLAFEEWGKSPALGVGTSAFAGPLKTMGDNAHNLVIDALVKTGVFGAIAVLAILVTAIVLCVQAAKLHEALPAGIVSAYLVIGMAQSDQGWIVTSLPWLWLVLATVLAGATVSSQAPNDQTKRGVSQSTIQQPSPMGLDWRDHGST